MTTTATTTEERQRQQGAAVVIAGFIRIVLIQDVAVVGVVGADYADAFITTTTCSITAAIAAAAAAPEVCIAVGEGLVSTNTAAGVGFVVCCRRRCRGRLATLKRRQELMAHPTLVASTAAADFRCLLLLGHPFQLPEVAAHVVGLSAAGREQVDGRIALCRSAQAADAPAFKNFSLLERADCFWQIGMGPVPPRPNLLLKHGRHGCLGLLGLPYVLLINPRPPLLWGCTKLVSKFHTR